MIITKKKTSSREARIQSLFGELMSSHAVGPNEQVSPGGIIIPEAKYGEDFDIVGLMNEARDPDTGLLRDLKIDDRDLAHASSFYDYAFTIIGEDAHPPWMVQMWTGLMLFSEVCPVCSDKRWLDLEWFIEHVDKGMPSKDIKQGMKILKHGVCPKCKRTKHELIINHEMHNYTELVNVLGQRSGKSSSASLYASYHTHRMLKFPRLADHTKAMQKSTELTGTFVSLTFAKALGLLWTPFINIINESRWFCIAEGTLISMGDGSLVPIESVSVGDYVITYESEEKEVLNRFDNGGQECFEVVLANGKVVVATAEHKFHCVDNSGERVWRKLKDLQLGDEVISISV